MIVAFAGLALHLALISLAVFFAQIDVLSLLARTLILSGGIAAAFLLSLEYRKHRASWALDISGTGDIRVSAASEANAPACFDSRSGSTEMRYLAAGSLITPLLLVLRLADSHDNINTLMVFPDSVSHDAFRRLSLACRWLSVQRHRQAQNFFL